LQALLVLLASMTLAFVLFRFMPGDPYDIMLNRILQEQGQTGGGSRENLEMQKALLEAYTNVDPEKPVPEAYAEYMYDIIVHQDFGRSIFINEPVFPFLFAKMPWSIFVSVYGLLLGRTTSLLLGAGMAYNEGSKFDSGLTAFTILNRAFPYYIVAIILLVAFAYIWPIFPTGGRSAPGTTPGVNIPFILGVLHHGALPIISTFVAGFGGALAFRGNCVREMGKEYIRVADIRGIPSGRIAIRYIGRNALLPVYTAIMLSISTVFGSSIILETIFNYPAVGYATFRAITQRDYPLLMGTFIFFTAITVAGILIADFTYGLIDPRVRGGGERESF